MKKLSIICALVMVFGVSLVQAQTYEVAPAGTKDFTTLAGVAPNANISLDIYLTAAGANQNAGGAWLDFTGSTAIALKSFFLFFMASATPVIVPPVPTPATRMSAFITFG